MPEEFYRIKRLPPYIFAEVNALKAQARGEGRDVIDLGMGNPDGPTPPHIVAKLIEAVQNPKTHGYSSSRGIAGLRRAYSAYYARRFNVELDPEREIIVSLGSRLAKPSFEPNVTIISRAALMWNSTRNARLSSRWARRRASPISPRRSPRRARGSAGWVAGRRRGG